MDKKQKITWGVSFGSLALVAGMVSYLGLSNGDKTDNKMTFNQGQQPGINTNQQEQDRYNIQQGQGPGQNSDDSWGGDSPSQFNQNDQAFGNDYDNGGQSSGSSNQQQDQFSNGGGRSSGHHHGFDTTTGGT
ncbi:hypothetical protein ACIQXV_25750 [Neobacillus sp. NPDC097160]|uniref:hypothetical protein n=1 Tax=Neobacillus sp. NPDC097160 TaxID=3364298 RepID=UPI00381511AA